MEIEENEEKPEEEVLEELADEFVNGDPDEVLEKLEELGYEIDDLPL